MRSRFDLIDIILVLFFAGCCLVGGLLIGMFWFGPQWYVSHNCLAYPFLLLDPHTYVACKMP